MGNAIRTALAALTSTIEEMMRAFIRVALLLSLVCLLTPHGSAEAQGNVLDQNDVVQVDSVGTNTIWFHRNTASVNSLESLIINRIKRAVGEISPVVEVMREDPPWATPMAEADLAIWRVKAEDEWFNPDYDYYAWFVGIGTDIPRGAGYSIGRRIVANYLASHPAESPSTLYATPAREFLADARQTPNDSNTPAAGALGR